jgi:hypothetical protein
MTVIFEQDEILLLLPMELVILDILATQQFFLKNVVRLVKLFRVNEVIYNETMQNINIVHVLIEHQKTVHYLDEAILFIDELDLLSHKNWLYTQKLVKIIRLY